MFKILNTVAESALLPVKIMVACFSTIRRSASSAKFRSGQSLVSHRATGFITISGLRVSTASDSRCLIEDSSFSIGSVHDEETSRAPR